MWFMYLWTLTSSYDVYMCYMYYGVWFVACRYTCDPYWFYPWRGYTAPLSSRQGMMIIRAREGEVFLYSAIPQPGIPKTQNLQHFSSGIRNYKGMKSSPSNYLDFIFFKACNHVFIGPQKVLAKKVYFLFEN